MNSEQCRNCSRCLCIGFEKRLQPVQSNSLLLPFVWVSLTRLHSSILHRSSLDRPGQNTTYREDNLCTLNYLLGQYQYCTVQESILWGEQYHAHNNCVWDSLLQRGMLQWLQHCNRIEHCIVQWAWSAQMSGNRILPSIVGILPLCEVHGSQRMCQQGTGYRHLQKQDSNDQEDREWARQNRDYHTYIQWDKDDNNHLFWPRDSG